MFSNNLGMSSNNLRMFSNDLRMFLNDLRMFSNNLRMFSNNLGMFLNDLRMFSDTLRIFFFLYEAKVCGILPGLCGFTLQDKGFFKKNNLHKFFMYIHKRLIIFTFSIYLPKQNI